MTTTHPDNASLLADGVYVASVSARRNGNLDVRLSNGWRFSMTPAGVHLAGPYVTGVLVHEALRIAAAAR